MQASCPDSSAAHDPTCAPVLFFQVYTIYSILFIVFIILVIVTAFITVALTYFQLAVEDHRQARVFVCVRVCACVCRCLHVTAWIRSPFIKPLRHTWTVRALWWWSPGPVLLSKRGGCPSQGSGGHVLERKRGRHLEHCPVTATSAGWQ